MNEVRVPEAAKPASNGLAPAQRPLPGAVNAFTQLLGSDDASDTATVVTPSPWLRQSSSVQATASTPVWQSAGQAPLWASTAPSVSNTSTGTAALPSSALSSSTSQPAQPAFMNHVNSNWLSSSFMQFMQRILQAMQEFMANFSNQPQAPDAADAPMVEPAALPGVGGGGGGGGGGGTGGGGKTSGSSAGATKGGGAGGKSCGGAHSGGGNSSTQASAGGGHTQQTQGTKGAAPAVPGKLPAAQGERVVNETIVVKAGETFDGQGMHFKAGPQLGDGSQSESQRPVFILEPGAKLKNVQVSGADGIHAKGDARLDNVWWRDVGEDAFTLKGPGRVEVHGGGAFNASDKIFQLNAGGSLLIDGFTADTFGKAVRTNGGKNFAIDITVTNSTFTNGQESIVRSDCTQANIKLAGNRISNTRYDVIAPQSADVQGASMRGWKSYTG